MVPWKPLPPVAGVLAAAPVVFVGAAMALADVALGAAAAASVLVGAAAAPAVLVGAAGGGVLVAASPPQADMRKAAIISVVRICHQCRRVCCFTVFPPPY